MITTKAVSHRGWEQTDPNFYSQASRFEAGASSQSRYMQWAMTLTLSGVMHHRLNGLKSESRCGDLCITAPDVDIWWQVPQSTDWYGVWAVFHPRPHWYAWLQLPEVAPGCTVLHLGETPLFGTMRRLMLKADSLYRSGSPDREAWAMLVLERALLALHADRRQQLDGRVQQAIEYLNTHYASALTLEDIARACHISVSHLSSLFQQQIGASPIQVLEQVRLQRAQEMLKLTFASVGEVAAAVGYHSPSYFIQRFRRYNGQTPREYRRAAQ